MFCASCGAENHLNARYCVSCGVPLESLAPMNANNQEQPAPTVAMATRESRANSKKEMYIAFIGEKNQFSYLHKFLEFDRQGGSGLSWHWPAFFVTFYWLLYRKMWLKALVYFVLPYIVLFFIGFIAGIFGNAGDAISSILILLFAIGIWVVPAIFANQWYYNHCQQKIAETATAINNSERRLGELSSKGGTSSIFIIIAVIFGFIFLIGILAAISIPAYQSYVIKAQLAQTLSIAKEATDAVDKYYGQYHKFPSSLELTSLASKLPIELQRLDIDSNSGVVNIKLSQTAAAGKSLQMQPTVDYSHHLSWKCMSNTIAPQYLPPACR